MDINKNYDRKVHKILKVYNSILVKCKNVPIIEDKNIIIVDCMDGMINAQIETRKPILYIQQPTSITFFLIDGTEAYIFIIKKSREAECIIEDVLTKLKNKNKLLSKNWNNDFVYDESTEKKNNSLCLIPQDKKVKFKFLKKLFGKHNKAGKRAKMAY